MGFWDYAKNGLNALVPPTALFDSTRGSVASSVLADPGADAEKVRKNQLYQQAGAAGDFADQGQGAWNGYQGQAAGALSGLQRVANGQDSVSALQLRQGLGQALAQQRSLAAGAAPQDAAGAARTAAIQSGRLAAGLSGQQALAGLQERQQAQQQYGQLLGQMSGQAANVALGSRQTATQGYGAGNAGAPEKSWIDKYGPLITDTAGAAAKASSDRRGKTDIQPGEAAANKVIDGLNAFTFRYKNPNTANNSNVAPNAPRLGVMAQDLERAGLGHTVVDSPRGKQVNGADLATANTGMIAALGRRVAELEGGPGPTRLGYRPPGPPPDMAALADETRARVAQAALLRRRAALRSIMAMPARRTPYDYTADSADGGSYGADAGGQ